MTADKDRTRLEPGLYFVATPIGNARDITLRALDILANADVLAAEDTRSLRRLMEIHGVPLNGRRVVAYHDHNGKQARPRLLRALADGKSVAYASEAGMPLVSDPGYAIAKEALESDVAVTSAPGASAVLAALAVSGLPTDCFVFAGFAPPKASARRTFLSQFSSVPGTLILFESPRRVSALLQTCEEVFGARDAAICRELTKKFEEVRRGSLGSLRESVEADPLRGEVVVCIASGIAENDPAQIEAMLRETLETESVKTASVKVSEMFGIAKRDAYQLALKIRDEM